MSQPRDALTNRVVVWIALVERAGRWLAAQCPEDWLDEHEQLRYRRYRFPQHAELYLVSHVLLRTSLSRYAGCAPRDWRFEFGAHGKPELVPVLNPEKLRFNLSHTTGLAACGVTRDRRIGVDVESLDRSNATLAIAKRYFSNQEYEQLSRLPPEQQHVRFLELWTLKEAYVKARGGGLSIALDSFSFVPLANERATTTWQVAFHTDDHGAADRWQFASLRPTAGHLLAVAMERGTGPDFEIEVRETDFTIQRCGSASASPEASSRSS